MKSFLFIFACLSFTMLWAQPKDQQDFSAIPSRYGYEINRYPVVSFNYFVDYQGSNWAPFLYVAVQVQNDYLQFKREGEYFYSEYEVTITIRDDKQTIMAKTWPSKVEVKDFEVTNSKRDFQFNNYSVDLAKEAVAEFKPGDYEMLILVHDMLSSREYKNKRKMTVSESGLIIADSSTAHTDLAFLRGNQILKAYPENLTATRKLLAFGKPYTAFARVHAPDADSIIANIRLYQNQDDQKGLIGQEFSNFVQSADGSFVISYLLPYEKMDEGDYTLRYTLQADTNALELERDFSVMWFEKPLYLYKVDLAVRPMKYLLPPAEMEKIKELSIEELQKWFEDYWKKIDPTPETAYNELMTEYYNRVTEAVRDYSTRFKEGWQTDRGMVLLLYGEPSEVENRKYAANSIPHIIWKYKKDDGEQIFTFVDKNKTGEFTLLTQDSKNNE